MIERYLSQATQHYLDLFGRDIQLLRLIDRNRLACLRLHLIDERVYLIAGSCLVPHPGRGQRVLRSL